MTSDGCSLGAFWGARQESVDACAERASAFLTRLSACDRIFAHWFERARSPMQAFEGAQGPDHDVLTKLLLKGRNRTDVGRNVLEDLGFSLSLWNGVKDDGDTRLGVSCGVYSPWNHNSCVIELPERVPAAERVLTVETLTCVVRATVSSWEPDWAWVVSNTHLGLLELVDLKPNVGWLLYLAAARGEIPKLPPPARVVPIEGHGNLIVVTEERFSAKHPEHVEAASLVAEILEGAGLLQPIPGPQPIGS